MKCYNCDTLLEENWNYCPNCKRKLRKNKIIEEEFVSCNEVDKCHTCSCDLSSNWNFCPVCGTSVEFYSDKAFVSVPTIATNDQVTTAPPVVVPIVEDTKIEEQSVIEENTVTQNSNIIYCPNCGGQATEEHMFCANCGAGLKVQESTPAAVNVEERKDFGYVPWLIVSILGAPLGFLLAGYVDEKFMSIGYVISLFSIIYAKVKYPKSKLVTTVFIVFIVLSVLAVIFFLVVVVLLMLACESCLGELSNCS